MGNCKFPISDEKLEMVCDKGDIYHHQYLRSNHVQKCENESAHMNFFYGFKISSSQKMSVNIYPSPISTLEIIGVVDILNSVLILQ